MRIILFIALIICIIFAKWIGIATSWLLTPIASNAYGSILIIFAVIYLIFEVTGINNKQLGQIHIKSKNKTGTKNK